MAFSDGGADISNPDKMATSSLLLIIGEPISPEHKDLILAEITKGLRSWDVDKSGIDLNVELAGISDQASPGEEGPEGSRVIRHSSDGLLVEILVNPQSQTVKNAVKNLLTTTSIQKCVIYAGHGFKGSGAWMLQDDVFTFTNFVQIFKDPDVEAALKQTEAGATLNVHCLDEGQWNDANMAKQDFAKILKTSVNPIEKLSDVSGILRFTSYLNSFIVAAPLSKLLPSSDVVGNIRFTRPTMYVFPGCQGDSALFGINGFNLLINGGYSRNVCFWGFTKHLDRIDAVLLTHLGIDNIFGIKSFLERKSEENLTPEIGYIYLNAPDKIKHSASADLSTLASNDPKNLSLSINLAEESNKVIEHSKFIGLCPQNCFRSTAGQTITPVNLYHKVGHGSLEMYILNPIQDTKELKDLYQQWGKLSSQFTNVQSFPLQNMLSVCSLLVWRPSDPTENITRIFFPGNAPQHKVIEGLEKLKTLDILKHPSCCDRDLHAKVVNKTKKTASVAPVARPTPTKVPSKSDLSKKPSDKSARMSPPRAAPKPIKEVTKTTNHDKTKEKEKPKSPTSSSTPSKSPPSGTSSSISPTKPASPTPAPQVVESSQPLLDLSAPVSAPVLAPSSQPISAPGISPDPLPDPTQFPPTETIRNGGHLELDMKTMDELGIYDDDFDFSQNGPAEGTNIPPSEPVTHSSPEDLLMGDDVPQSLPEPVAVPFTENEQVHVKAEVVDPVCEKSETLKQSVKVEPGVASEVTVGSEEHDVSEVAASEEPEFDPMLDVEQPQSLPEPIGFPAYPDEAPVAVTVEDKLEDFSGFKQSTENDDKLIAERLVEPDLITSHQEQEEMPATGQSDNGFAEPLIDDVSEAANDDPLFEESHAVNGIDEGLHQSQPLQRELEPEIETEALGEEAPSSQDIDSIKIGQTEENETVIPGEIQPVHDEEDEDEEDDYPQEGFERDSIEREFKPAVQQEMDRDSIEKDVDVAKGGIDRDSLEREKVQPAAHGDSEVEELDHEENSSIPAAFEKDDTPSPDRQCVQQEVAHEVSQASGLLLDDEKDIDESMYPQDNGFHADVAYEDNRQHYDQAVPMRLPSIGVDENGSFLENLKQSPSDEKANQFAGLDKDSAFHGDVGNGDDREFSPSKDWGEPMGLPLPMEPAATAQANGIDSAKPAAKSKTGPTKPADKTKAKKDETKPAASASRLANKSMTKAPGRVVNGDAKTGKAGDKPPAEKKSTAERKPLSKPRPSTAPVKTEKADVSMTEAKAKPPSRRPATTTGKPKAPPAKPTFPLPPMTAYYMDLTYVPAHADPNYVDVEFFKRVRARYYVFSSLLVGNQVLNALLEAKQSWENKDLEVTVIPTYDGEILRHWMVLNRDQLAELKIDIAPAASRCTIQLQEHEASCSSYRLEF